MRDQALIAAILVACASPAFVSAQSPTAVAPASPAPQASQKETLVGAANYTRVDAVVACGGTTTPEAFGELQRRGFRAVLNLREATEPGANVEDEGALVRSLGMAYLHIPMNSTAPTAEPVERFLAALDDPAHQPIYIHCGTANRVGGVWFVKRVLRDGWTIDRAMEEATAIGLSRPALREFVLTYVKERQP